MLFYYFTKVCETVYEAKYIIHTFKIRCFLCLLLYPQVTFFQKTEQH